jgi:nicotinamide-nucleotide amidase
MNAIIISIGDELLIGQVINSNAAFIAEKLNSVGIHVGRIVTVGDDEHDIVDCFKEHYSTFDLCIVTGGLGPTHDDVTRSAVCTFFGVGLVQSEEAKINVMEFLRKRNRAWTPAAEDQTNIPSSARVIPNVHGSAPGELIERDNKIFIVMPGVPYEMESMMTDSVIPYVRSKATGHVILQRTLHTTGIAESDLAEHLQPLDEILKEIKIAYLPSPTGVRLRLTISGTDHKQCEDRLRAIESGFRKKIGRYVYGVDGALLEEVLGNILTEQKLTIAIAESCTGGMITHKMTNIPGCSAYIERGVVCYSNQSKTDLLGVPPDLLAKHGAVSRETAEAMAIGVRDRSKTDIGVSTTGIAGPAGGTPGKPVGLIWIGYADQSGSETKMIQLGGGRLQIKERATQAAMEFVRRKLLKLNERNDE